MATYLVDEDLPRSLAQQLRAAGFEALDLRDVGLRGSPDEAVVAFAVGQVRTVITADVGIGNVLRFPLGSHAGIVVVRFPNDVRIGDLNAAIVTAVRMLNDIDLSGAVVSLSPARIRVRRGAVAEDAP